MPCRTAHEKKIFSKTFNAAKKKYGAHRAFAVANAAVNRFKKKKR